MGARQGRACGQRLELSQQGKQKTGNPFVHSGRDVFFAGDSGYPWAAAQQPGLLPLRVLPHRPQSPGLAAERAPRGSCQADDVTDAFPSTEGRLLQDLGFPRNGSQKLLTVVFIFCISYNKEVLALPVGSSLTPSHDPHFLFRMPHVEGAA